MCIPLRAHEFSNITRILSNKEKGRKFSIKKIVSLCIQVTKISKTVSLWNRYNGNSFSEKYIYWIWLRLTRGKPRWVRQTGFLHRLPAPCDSWAFLLRGSELCVNIFLHALSRWAYKQYLSSSRSYVLFAQFIVNVHLKLAGSRNVFCLRLDPCPYPEIKSVHRTENEDARPHLGSMRMGGTIPQSSLVYHSWSVASSRAQTRAFSRLTFSNCLFHTWPLSLFLRLEWIFCFSLALSLLFVSPFLHLFPCCGESGTLWGSSLQTPSHPLIWE